MKKHVLTILILLSALHFAFSQVSSIQLVATNSYYFHARDVLKVMIVNDLNQTEKAILKASIYYFDAPTVQIESNEFELNPQGGYYDLSTNVKSISWNSSGLKEADENYNGMLPGYYRICYEVYGFRQNKAISFIDGLICETFKIEFPTPLMLAYPLDQSEIEETTPVFNWIAPIPAGLEKSINYKMSLYENSENLPKSSILNKRPLAIIPTIEVSTALPTSIKELELGKSYIWKVDAYLGENFLVTSEVWEFKIKKPVKEMVPNVFVKLNSVNQDVHIARDFLRVVYTSDKLPGTVEFKISNPSDGRVIQQGTYRYDMGENYWEIPIHGLNLENEKFLTIEFSTAGQSYSMKFLPVE